MIIYKNGVKTPNLSKTKVTIGNFSDGLGALKDESVKKVSDAKAIFNFDISDGSLKAGDGLKEFTIGGKALPSLDNDAFVKKLYYFENSGFDGGSNQEILLAYATNGKMYVLNLLESEPIFIESEVSFKSAPNAVIYNNSGDNVMLLSTFSDALYVYDGTTFKLIEDAPKLSSMCVHNERIFATESDNSTSLWFSDDFNPLNWNVSIEEAGYIDFPDERGTLLKVVSFLDYVYVFREYGISRLTAYGSQQDFTVSHLHCKVGKIYGESVTDCGNYIYFLSSNGFYRFNGLDAVKILDCYDTFLDGVDNKNASGCYYDGKLYVVLDMKIDKKIQNVVLVYNLLNGTSYIMKDCKISSLCVFNGQNKELISVYNDGKKIAKVVKNYGKVFEKPLKKVWQGIESDFSLSCVKNLYKITLNAQEDVEVLITCDGKERVFKLNKQNFAIYPKLKGKYFSISIISYNNNPRIFKPVIYFKYLKEHLW